MEEDFIPYKQALALKELGFNKPCFGWFWGDMSGGLHIEYIARNADPYVSAPLYQQAFKWFRGKGIDVHIMRNDDLFISNGGKKYVFFIDGFGGGDTYEEAELACLIKLIEITQNKQQ